MPLLSALSIFYVLRIFVTTPPTCAAGASGVHVVLPSYYAPSGIGLVDMNTSDGRFLFFLPWEGHVLVGTTDRKAVPTMRPIPLENEINWILTEASKYLTTELQVRRSDVLSAWSGIRPLAYDPHADSQSVQDEYGFKMLLSISKKDLNKYQGIIFTVAHDEFKLLDLKIQKRRIIYDIKSFLKISDVTL